MFRNRPGSDVWHFYTNCPHWPDDYEEYDDDASHMHDGRQCGTCLRLLAADTGNPEEPAYSEGLMGLATTLGPEACKRLDQVKPQAE